MHHQHVTINGPRHQSKACNILILLVVLAICELSFVAGQDFCGHSAGLRRPRRAGHVDLETQAQRGADLGGQIPENQQEVQIVIDETNGQVREENRTTGARIECSRSTSSSRMNGAGLDKLGDGCTSIKTIETAVFIDQALDSKFNGLSGGLVDLNKLVLSIMNQVQHLFTYSSLKIPIKIKLVLVEHLKEIERSGNQVPKTERGDIDAYLSNFCNWQYSRLQQNKRLWWDHAILLSG